MDKAMVLVIEDEIELNNILVEVLMMPVMNGIEFIRQSLLHNLDLNICLITGNNNTSFLIEALQLGAIDYIAKPFQLNLLLEKIEIMVDIGKREQRIRGRLEENMMVHNSLKMNNLLKLKNSQIKETN